MTPPRLLSVGELERKGAIVAIQDGNHGEKHPKGDDYVESGVPFIMACDLGEGRVDISGCKFLEKEQADRLRIGFAREGDVLLTHKGTVGLVAVVPKIDGYVMLTPQVTYYRVNPVQLNNQYLAYAFREPGFQARIHSISVQSTRPYVGITAQRELKLLVWPLREQIQIASILSAYDNLIENNTRRIAILEEMARSLYREWFVHFRFPGHEKVKMVDSPLGRIPDGWEVRRLDDLASVNELSLKKDNYPTEIRYIDIASVSTGRIDSIVSLPFSEAPGRARRIVRHGDVLWSTVRPNRQSYAMILEPAPNTIASTGFAVITAKVVPPPYIYHAVTTEDFVGYLVNHATGSAYPAVSAEDFKAAMLMLPAEAVLSAFGAITGPILCQQNRLALQNNNLRATRDLLLPKLISGEVDVSNLDINATEATQEAASG